MAYEVGLSTASQGLSGASSGAMAGLGIEAGLIAAGLASGPIGWAGLAIGAGVGALTGGGIGFLGGQKARKANSYARKAARIQIEREQNATEAQMLQYIRQGRITRAASQASAASLGLATSSLSTSALSSIGSQSEYNVQYLAEDRRLYNLYRSYLKKANKRAQEYQNLIALQGAISSLAGSAGDILSIYGKMSGAPGGRPSEFISSAQAQQPLQGDL